MKNLIYLILIITAVMVSFNSKAQDKTEDEWEMKQFYFVILNSPAERPKMDSAKVAELQAAHLGHIEQMFKEGKCRLAGPFLEKGEMRGILILDVASREEAEKLCSEDPFVINGFLIPLIKPWYGPAGLYVQPKAK